MNALTNDIGKFHRFLESNWVGNAVEYFADQKTDRVSAADGDGDIVFMERPQNSIASPAWSVCLSTRLPGKGPAAVDGCEPPQPNFPISDQRLGQHSAKPRAKPTIPMEAPWKLLAGESRGTKGAAETAGNRPMPGWRDLPTHGRHCLGNHSCAVACLPAFLTTCM